MGEPSGTCGHQRAKCSENTNMPPSPHQSASGGSEHHACWQAEAVSSSPRGPESGHGGPGAPSTSPPGHCVDRPAPGASGDTTELTQARWGTAPGGWGEERPAQGDRGCPAG